MIRKKNALLIFVFLFLSSGFFFSLRAAEVNVDFTTPGLDPAGSTIPGFIGNLYLFSLGIAGFFAFGTILVGGILYMVSGAVDKKNEAKEFILGAIWGLLLLFGSYAILLNINPELVKLKNPGEEVLAPTQYSDCVDRKDLPLCTEQQTTDRGPDGQCICRKISKLAQCPLSVEKTIYSQLPIYTDLAPYTWTKESGALNGRNGILSFYELPPFSESEDACPRLRLEPGTTPLVITDVKDGKFFMDLDQLEKRTSLDSSGSIPLPLPDDGSEYWAEMKPIFIKNHPEKALCILSKVIMKKGGNVTTLQVKSIPKEDEKIDSCSTQFEEKDNEAEVEIKNMPKKPNTGQCAEVGACTTDKIKKLMESYPTCTPFIKYASDLAGICAHESGGEVVIKSGTDVCLGKESCANPKTKDKEHAFSVGIFQTNLTSSIDIIKKINPSLGQACSQLFNKKIDGKFACSPKYTSGYKCSFTGDDGNYKTCALTVMKLETQIKISCELMQTSRSVGIFSPWKKAYMDCGIENVKL